MEIINEKSDDLSAIQAQGKSGLPIDILSIPDSKSESVERQTWIIHKGVKICFRDCRNLCGEEAMRIVLCHMSWLQNTKHQDIRFLLDITDAVVDREILKLYKENSRAYKNKFHKIAVVGAVGLLHYFCMVVIHFAGIDAKFFHSQKEALDWLAE